MMGGLWGIQLIGVLFALLMLYLTFINLRRGEFSTKETLFWVIAWFVFLLLSIFPIGLDFLVMNWLAFSRRLDFFIVLGFMFLIAVVFYTYTAMRKTQNKLEKLVRKIALKKRK